MSNAGQDIVERLKDQAKWHKSPKGVPQDDTHKALRDAAAEITRLREIVDNYAQHTSTCHFFMVRDHAECECGLSAALAAKRAEVGK